MRICRTCAWYCYADGMCYVPAYQGPVECARACRYWTADGLDEEERVELESDALVTVDEVESWQN